MQETRLRFGKSIEPARRKSKKTNAKEDSIHGIGGKNADYLICVCKKKTLGEVRDLIREHHITDLKTLCEKADIGNKCGRLAAKCSMSFCRRKCNG